MKEEEIQKRFYFDTKLLEIISKGGISWTLHTNVFTNSLLITSFG